MSSKREQNRLTTISRILAAARELVLSHKSTDFSMPQLAKTAGVALTTPYKHFGSKAGVLNALLDDLWGDDSCFLADEIDLPLNPLDRVLNFSHQNIRNVVEHEDLTRPVMAGLVKLNGNNPLDVSTRWTPLWQSEMQQALDSGLVHSFVNTYLVARSLHLAFMGAITKWLSHETNSEQLVADVNYCTIIIMLGVATDKGQPLLRHRFSEAELSSSAALKRALEIKPVKQAV